VRPAAGGAACGKIGASRIRTLNYRLLILLGLALAALAVWLTLATEQGRQVTAQASRPNAPEQGYAATDALVVETGTDGLPLYTLQAREVQQSPDDNLVNLTTVHMTFHDESGGQWQAQANHSQVRQDSAQIDLSGSIDAIGTFAGSALPVHFLSDTLHVDTQSDMLRTRSAVTLDWSGWKLSARGMETDLKNHRVKLEAQVHGSFIP
jgi:lipopolysaccharide export system protein LptC